MGYGLLAEIATILTIILIAMAYRYAFARGLSDADYALFGERAGAIVGTVGGTLYTYLFARRLMRLLTVRLVGHGVVVALTAVAFSIAGSIAGHHGVPGAYVLASILKVGAGALAGFLYSRSLRNRNVV